MTEFKNIVANRRSHRKFTTEEIDSEAVKLILRAALMSPTSKSNRSWHFVVVEDRMTIEKIADAKDMGSQFLKEAPLVVVVTGCPDRRCRHRLCINAIPGRGTGAGLLLGTV